MMTNSGTEVDEQAIVDDVEKAVQELNAKLGHASLCGIEVALEINEPSRIMGQMGKLPVSVVATYKAQLTPTSRKKPVY